MSAKSKDVETALKNLTRVTGLINGAIFQCRNSRRWIDAYDDALLAILVQAGYMADKAIDDLGGSQMCGTIEEWMNPEELPECKFPELAVAH